MKENRKTVLSWAYKSDAVQYFPLWNSLDIKDQKLLMWDWGFTEIFFFLKKDVPNNSDEFSDSSWFF